MHLAFDVRVQASVTWLCFPRHSSHLRHFVLFILSENVPFGHVWQPDAADFKINVPFGQLTAYILCKR